MISFTELMNKLLLKEISFNQLLNKSEPGRVDRAKTVSTRSTRVKASDDGEMWTFNYKTNPIDTTTDKRYHGKIQFLKEDVAATENAGDLDCKVHCDCPDYFYRWEYNNAKAGAGTFDPKLDGQMHNRRPPKPTGPPHFGVGNLGNGMCKHLIALSEYLNSKIEAPQPPVQPTPVAKPKPEVKPSVPSKPSVPTAPLVTKQMGQPPVKPAVPFVPKTPVKPVVKPKIKTTVDAPEIDDYSDTRTDLQEGGKSALYSKFEKLVRETPIFDITYEETAT